MKQVFNEKTIQIYYNRTKKKLKNEKIIIKKVKLKTTGKMENH